LRSESDNHWTPACRFSRVILAPCFSQISIPTAGQVDLFPQEITRVLLNLISNGFYAATKRKAENHGGDYEPTLLASTKSLGDSVEIRIRDNGTGIPAEVRDKMFNLFFTT
jgi:signal transduction histidine kinase